MCECIGNLAALVYQHSLTPLALPIKLILPTQDLVLTNNSEQVKTEPPSSKSSQSISQQQQQQQQQQQPQQQQQQPQTPTSPQIQDARVLLEKGAGMWENKKNIQSMFANS